MKIIVEIETLESGISCSGTYTGNHILTGAESVALGISCLEAAKISLFLERWNLEPSLAADACRNDGARGTPCTCRSCQDFDAEIREETNC